MNNDKNSRRIVGNIALSLDGRTTGAGGDHDMGWIVPHAVTDAARDHMIRVTEPATTVLLGRKNYQGFGGFWPAVAGNADADPRDRAFSAWLNRTEKVVFSTTLTEASWENSRIVAGDLPGEVRRLREQDGGDIIVLASGSIIRALLEAELLDRLSITLCPALVGGGARLLEDGLPASTWALTDTTMSASGAICLLYDRLS
ncbi:riboflavin biosynthesis protein RibD [Actinoplanes sp. ATCC 53533]|uniref:dihydrofolate reductase family protein n=1 Tax=Actinoplanes sp. ATCC 53533 TaxID=1288362 RepID=UPI000F765ECA|nr:dihydrofolate reductase family protein [Actinoplanes sp. ATCC 53533]RSM48599.1 riboflavin biosynthesis protein RibD [Actinoplanes sp. ATCC 53533]